MNYEKAYKEALERARRLEENSNGMILKKWLWNVFPELKESEDEKIRKALVEYFGEQCDMSDWNGVYGYQVLAWLKKQGEQKADYSEEDERIRKDIIRVFKGEISYTSKEENEKYIAWLEKQGKKGGEE